MNLLDGLSERFAFCTLWDRVELTNGEPCWNRMYFGNGRSYLSELNQKSHKNTIEIGFLNEWNVYGCSIHINI